tara:strand:- start:244 stop:405 length:162 start_codon:yes stop_codon:yes gene_type:complete
VKIPQSIEFICGRIDWAKTERIKIKDLPEVNGIEMDAFFTPKPLRMFGSLLCP